MAESSLHSCLPRLRRLSLCLFCNTEEGDGAVIVAIENVPSTLTEQGQNDAIVKFLFLEILNIASIRFKNEHNTLSSHYWIGEITDNEHAAMIKAVSELGLFERSVVALNILDSFDESATAEMLNASVSDVTKALAHVRTFLSNKISSPKTAISASATF